MQTMDHSKMDMNDPDMLAMMKKCMPSMSGGARHGNKQQGHKHGAGDAMQHDHGGAGGHPAGDLFGRLDPDRGRPTRAGAPGNSFAFLMTGVSTDYAEIMVLREATKSWRIALFLPLLTVPQVILIAWLMNGVPP